MEVDLEGGCFLAFLLGGINDVTRRHSCSQMSNAEKDIETYKTRSEEGPTWGPFRKTLLKTFGTIVGTFSQGPFEGIFRKKKERKKIERGKNRSGLSFLKN